MGFWDDLQEKAKQVAKKAGETFEDAKDYTTVEFKVLQLKRQISLCEGEIKELQNQIGKKVYDMRAVAPEGFAVPEIQSLCDRIGEQLGAISELEKQIIDAREQESKPAPPDTTGTAAG